MAYDGVLTTVNMPPAFLGVAYEACVAVKSQASLVTAQSIVSTGVAGLPAGLALDAVAGAPGSFRISGTPTGAASSGGVPQSGVGAYVFSLSVSDTAGTGTLGPLTINLYRSPQDLVIEGQHTTQDGLN